MPTHSRIRRGMTIEEFVRWPRIDEQPYLEYYDGRIEERMAGAVSHSLLISKFSTALDRFAEPTRLGRAFPILRCNFGGRSLVGDVVFLLDSRIRRDEQGQIEDETSACPDVLVEIRSPGESVSKAHARLMGSAAEGCPLGWFVDPLEKTVDVFRRGLPPERLASDGFFDANPVLPGFRSSVIEVFDCLFHRNRRTETR